MKLILALAISVAVTMFIVSFLGPRATPAVIGVMLLLKSLRFY